jgi:type VI secretion system protein ImpI
MALKMRVTGENARDLGAAAEHLFSEGGGTIGRGTDNDWRLPDSVVSGKHAEIRCDNGEYYLRDTSTNGTVVNTIHLSRGDERPLHHGDVLQIGSYDIAVEIDASGISASSPPSQSFQDPLADSGHAETLDPLKLIGPASSAKEVDFPPEGFDFSQEDAQSDHVPSDAQHMELPPSVPDPSPYNAPENGPEEIPPDWNKTGFSGGTESASRSSPSPPEVRSPEPPVPSQTGEKARSSDEDGISALLKAAGVPPEAITAETYKVLGQIIEVVVRGTVDVLRSRAQIKDEFRVSATRLKPVENNPLKFSVNAQDALHNLFGKSNPGYQSPVSAFEDGFEDIKAHQMAMIAGMRAAYEALFDYFNPEELEAQFERQLRRGVLGNVLNKTRYWGMYEELYESFKKDSETTFHRLFGDEFGKAYAEQMDRLSAKKRN